MRYGICNFLIVLYVIRIIKLLFYFQYQLIIFILFNNIKYHNIFKTFLPKEFIFKKGLEEELELYPSFLL